MKTGILSKSAVILSGVLILLLFTGCGADSKNYNAVAEEDYWVSEESGTSVTLTDTADGATDNISDNRKIIEYIDLTIQTKEFDKLIEGLESEIKALGGYTESSSISGNGYDSDDTRYAELTVRIPSDKSGNFTEFVSENSVVINKSVSTDDVTLTYVDMESRVEVLEAEKESLEKLLKNAETMSDIITIREKLTEVIGDIESYKSQLRTYDNLVSYSTVTITIYEVEHTAIVEKQNVWQKIGTNLKNNFSNVWDGFLAVFVFTVSSIPYLIPLIIIAVVVIIVLRIKRKNDRKNKN